MEHVCVGVRGDMLEVRAALRTVDDLLGVGLEVGAHEDALRDALREVKALVRVHRHGARVHARRRQLVCSSCCLVLRRAICR